MRLLAAIAIMVGMGAVLGLGIVLAARGHPWLLISGGLAYGVAFARLGCLGR